MMDTEISEPDLAWWLGMAPTSFSLLERLKVAGPDAADWNRLQGIYLPLVQRWLSRVPGLGDEAADLAKSRVLKRLREEAGNLLE